MKIALLKNQIIHVFMGGYIIFSYINFSEEPIEIEVDKRNNSMNISFTEYFKYGINVYGDNFEVLDENSNVIGSDTCVTK